MGVQIACVVWPDRAEAVRRLRAWEACLDALEGFSSIVEAEAPGVAYVDITSLAPHYPDVETLAQVLVRTSYAAAKTLPSVGVAASAFAARIAAEGLSPGEVAVWPVGTERERLASLSVRLLPLDEDTLDSLWQAGLRTLDEVARLPATVIASTFGPTLWRAQRLARGEALRPLRPRQVILATHRFASCACTRRSIAASRWLRLAISAAPVSCGLGSRICVMRPTRLANSPTPRRVSLSAILYPPLVEAQLDARRWPRADALGDNLRIPLSP